MDTDDSAPRLLPGAVITIAGAARPGHPVLESEAATVEHADSASTRVIAPTHFDAMPGTTVFLQLGECGPAGWTQVLDVSPADAGLRLLLGPVRWEEPGSERAPRTECDYRIIATWITADPDTSLKDTKRTIGSALNISRSGVRFRLRSTVSVGTMMQLQIYYNVNDCITAMAKVARVAESGSEVSGFEVAANFIRVLAGVEILNSLAPAA
jgi:hypothetical protein